MKNTPAENGHGRTARTGRSMTRQGWVLSQENFHALLALERRRAERSRKVFALMLVDSHAVPENEADSRLCERIKSIVSNAARESDLVGWFEESAILGVIFTELNLDGETPVTDVLHSKIVTALRGKLHERLASKVTVSIHLFPEDRGKFPADQTADNKMHRELFHLNLQKRRPTIAKRAIDIVGSSMMLLLSSPVLAAAALAIKLTSKGPVIFKQERVGQLGDSFHCLKFRTMYIDNNPMIHREYVKRLIAGKAEKMSASDAEPGVYKITSDPRVTRIGKFLRRTSLDEFPQFWNVLRGEMSLVGPRPPLPYEFEVYDLWHRRRVLEMKPGITGLWQVSGRSRVCFDDMVRLDLSYSKRWSLWLDFKILLATPLAVLTGVGAF